MNSVSPSFVLSVAAAEAWRSPEHVGGCCCNVSRRIFQCRQASDAVADGPFSAVANGGMAGQQRARRVHVEWESLPQAAPGKSNGIA
jgi:hypothetical protein